MKKLIQKFLHPFRITNFAFLIIFFLSSCWANPFWSPIFFPKKKADNKWIWLIPLVQTGNTANGVTVTGMVTYENGVPLGVGGMLTFEPSGITVTTDANGNYIVSLPPGTYTVTVTHSSGTVIGTFSLSVNAEGSVSVIIDSGGINIIANGSLSLSMTSPIFSPAIGDYKTSQSVAITTTTSGATIYYTVDGSAPVGMITSSSLQYTTPISVAVGTTKTIKAMAIKSGFKNSAVVSGTWNVGYVNYSWGTFTDNYDGTVKFIGVAGTFGGNVYLAQTLTFMKCSQGQIWNSSTNSCDGSATAYQFCTTYDNNCNGGVSTNELGVGGFLGGSTSGAYNQCNDLVFAGKTDWRLPKKNELKTLIHCTNKTMPSDNSSCYSYISPSTNYLFPNTIAHYYWSSSTYTTPAAWLVYFSYGYVSSYGYKTSSYYVRCVR